MRPVLVRIGRKDKLIKTPKELRTIVAKFTLSYDGQMNVHKVTGLCTLKQGKTCNENQQVCDREGGIRYCRKVGKCDLRKSFEEEYSQNKGC